MLASALAVAWPLSAVPPRTNRRSRKTRSSPSSTAMKSAPPKSRWRPTTSSASCPTCRPSCAIPSWSNSWSSAICWPSYAVKEGIAETDEYKRRLALYQAKALRDAYFFQTIRPQVTEERSRPSMTRKPRRWRRPSACAPVTFWWPPRRKPRTFVDRLAKGEKFEDAGQAVQPRRFEGLWWRSRLLHGARNGAGILQGGLRAEGRRSLAAGEDRFRLAHHQAGRPQDGRGPAL